MKGFIVSIFLFITLWTGFAENPAKKTIYFGGYEREYLLYIPQTSQSKFDGLVIGLHGFNSSMYTFFEDITLSKIADSLNYVLIAPQALPEKSQNVINDAALLESISGQKISLNSVWGCGLKVTAMTDLFGVNVKLLDDELNRTIDDAGFIDYLINNILSEYTINSKNIFLIGTSMGGYMSYQYTLLYGSRLAGMVSIVGTMGTAIKGIDNQIQIPICDFHSLTDEVVPYTGTYNLSGISVTLGKNKNEVIDYWAKKNNTGTANVENFPIGNGIKVKKFTYPNPEHEVIHYQMDGSGHSYVFSKEKGDSMDYEEEILKFLSSHTTNDKTGIKKPDEHNLYFYPNPVKDKIYFSVETGTCSIYNLTGKLLYSQSFQTRQANISGLKSGMYLIRIHSGEQTLTTKLVKN